MKTDTRNRLRMIISFTATIAVIVLFLKLLNWIPIAIQKADLRKYKTIEQAQAAMKNIHIFIPSYFPEYIQWPPSEIFAQRKPAALVIMHFTHHQENNVIMSLYQAESSANFSPETDVLHVKDEKTISLKGRDGRLTLALCRGNRRCNTLSIREGAFTITLVADDTPDQILKIAESMLKDGAH